MLFKKFASLTLLAATAFAQAPKGAAFDHIVIIFLENTDYALASTDSYFQALIPQGILLDNYHGLAHPSQPNYIASIGGSTHSVTSDSTYNLSPSYSTIVDLLEAKQLTWKTYQENIPSVCYTGSSSSSLYYRKHNPFVSYGSIYKNSTRCKNVVSATQFTTDVNNGALPNYSFYTPNIKNDGHDTTNTLVVVTFDEAEDYSDTTNHVLALLLGDAVNGTANTVDSTYYTHYSLISTVENNWGLGNLNLGDVGQLGNVFNLVASKTGYQNVAVTNPPPLNN
ncbi:hypothetical protein BGZ79_007481 [Entomortierella chlamydospora]|nr:hypothetical protein BGZ79_007481 [Entomortierella chlamydospora]